MRTRYQRAFDHVTASERLEREVLNMTKQEKQALRRRIPRAVLIAAVLALLLAGTALAVNVPGIQAWFQRYWEDAAGTAEMPPAQQEVLDDLTQSVEASAAAEPPEQAEVSGLPETSADAEPSESRRRRGGTCAGWRRSVRPGRRCHRHTGLCHRRGESAVDAGPRHGADV